MAHAQSRSTTATSGCVNETAGCSVFALRKFGNYCLPVRSSISPPFSHIWDVHPEGQTTPNMQYEYTQYRSGPMSTVDSSEYHAFTEPSTTTRPTTCLCACKIQIERDITRCQRAPVVAPSARAAVPLVLAVRPSLPYARCHRTPVVSYLKVKPSYICELMAGRDRIVASKAGGRCRLRPAACCCTCLPPCPRLRRQSPHHRRHRRPTHLRPRLRLRSLRRLCRRRQSPHHHRHRRLTHNATTFFLFACACAENTASAIARLGSGISAARLWSQSERLEDKQPYPALGRHSSVQG